jgi:hypothetical protein
MDALHRLRGDFSASAQKEKARLLRVMAQEARSRAPSLMRFHDELLFLAAFPDNPTIAALVRRALAGFYRRVRLLTPRRRARLADTGIAGSESTHALMFGAVQWLVRQGQRVAPAWLDERAAEHLEPFIRMTILPSEADAFDNSGLSTRRWIEHASARVRGGPLSWLLGTEGGLHGARELYDHAEVPVTWSLGDSPRSVTRNRGPVSTTIFRRAFRRPPPDPVQWISRPLRGVRRVTGVDAARWIDASIAALVARCREVVPTIYANAEEVYVADLGEGAQVCVIAAQPDDRLALEANYGYVMYSNGVPVGYGGVTPLANQANTGANLFEAFRGSEAAFLFGQSLRAFRAIFGISRFVVNPFQFGAGNDEALQSGAFWFYDRLGFRSTDAGARALAVREGQRLAARRGARTPVATLRRLSASNLVLELDPASAVPLFDEHYLVVVGALVADLLSGVPAPDRDSYLTALVQRQARLSGGAHRRLTASELRGGRLLSPVIALIERDVAAWTPAARRALWALVRAKGTTRERRFAQLARVHAPFWSALSRRCAQARTLASRRR